MSTESQDAWLLRVLAIDTAAIAAGKIEAEQDAGPRDIVVLRERLAIVLADVKLYKAQQLGPAVKKAGEALKAGDPAAADMIEALEEEVAKLTSAVRREEAAAEIGQGAMGKAGVVAFAKMRLRWQAARASHADAVSNVVDGLRALLETDEFQDDPRSEEAETLQLIDALAARLPRLDDVAGAINDALDSVNDAPDKRAQRVAAAGRAIERYEQQLSQFDDLREFENGEAGSFPSISLIESALADLKKALAAAEGSATETERTAA